MESTLCIQKLKDSELQIDLEKGAKIMLLTLDGVTVIKVSQQGDFLGSGSYLMYPWVNRLEVYPKAEFKDGAGLPLHGLYATRKRNLTRTQTSDSIILELTCESFHEEYPHFKEIFTLTANSLSIEFQLISESKQEIVCFGYHPYLQLNNVKLTNQNVRFQTDMKEHMHLQSNLLPIYPFKTEPAKIIPGEKYDSLFRGGSYFSIVCQQLHKQVRIQSDELRYWQIYTPDETRIAVEPMSFCGNIFAIRQHMGEQWPSLPRKAIVQISVTSL